VTAKGKPGPLNAFRLADVDLEAAPVARRLDTPLVGRRSELEQLTGAFERTVRERRCHLFTVLGVAGVGKSRLVAELLSGLDATVLHGRCLDYGEGITFWPVISVLKQLGERAEGTLARLVEGASTPNELFWTVRGQLEEVALERPLVVCFDDIQWGEETFLDLVDHVADLSRGVPLLLLCAARPELLDKRPGWGGGKLNATTVLLEPLTADECLELIAAHGGVEPETRERILAAADGNPLFVEEMLALAREDGGVGVPGTVQALLQARLDQLGSDERTVIEHGAVEGQIFHRSAVVELTRSADVESQLVGLVRKELIHPATPTFAGDHAFRFRHLLIRDAAYDALSKETRAELHERFAAWLERHGQELIELDEVLGYHLEQAARYRRELGRPSLELEQWAGRALAAAGARAVARSDAQGSLNLLRRAVALLPEDDERRAAALVDQLIVLGTVGQVEERVHVIELLEGSSDKTLRMHGRIARLLFRLQSEPEQVVGEAEQAVEEALALFTAGGDDLGAAHAYNLAAAASWLQSRALPTAAAVERQIEHARRAGATGRLDDAFFELLGPLGWGPFGTDEVRAHLDTFSTSSSVTARFCALSVETHLSHRAGRFDEALATVREMVALAEDFGLTLVGTIARWQSALVLHAAGRLDEAVEAYRSVLEQFEAQGQTSFRSTALIDFARVVYEQGDPGETERLVAEGQALGAAEDVINFAFGQSLRARIAADRGDPGAADELARQALDFAYRTDFPGVHASAHEALARALSAAGRADEARSEDERALDLWERYDYTFEAARLRARLASGPVRDARATRE
jgi:tetratricopeptide (TPR) repeat protein